MGYFSPLFWLFALPGFALAMYAQWRVKSNFNKYAKVRTRNNITGSQVARRLLDAHQLYDVKVERVNGFLSDHYDPRSKTLRLSEATHDSPSVAAAGIAAHEMGHALQHANNYIPLQIRSAIVPAVKFGSGIGPMLLMGGVFLQFTALAWVGVALFAATTIFTLVTLPVEFDASNRAKKLLKQSHILDLGEMEGVNKVLDSAALTYVAAAVQSIGTLLYYVMLLSGRGGRRR